MHTFSEITEQDVAQVIELWRGCGAAHATSDLAGYVAAARHPPSASIIVGKKADSVVCAAMVGFTGQCGWINDICVDKRFQRQGFGRTLVAAAETWLAERGAPEVRLKVPYTNLRVIGFYDKLGYCFQDAVVLGKRIPPTASNNKNRELL